MLLNVALCFLCCGLQELFDQFDRLDVDLLVEKLGSKKAGEAERGTTVPAQLLLFYRHLSNPSQ